MARFLSHFMSV